MRGGYTVNATNVTLAGAVTAVFVNPGTTVTLEFLRAWASQAANATSNQQRIQLSSQPTAFATLTGVTPAQDAQVDQVSKIVSGTAGAAGTAGVNASAEGSGTKVVN